MEPQGWRLPDEMTLTYIDVSSNDGNSRLESKSPIPIRAGDLLFIRTTSDGDWTLARKRRWRLKRRWTLKAKE